MLFRKRRKPGGPQGRAFKGGTQPPEGLYPIHLDMMLKGSVVKRHGKEVRQFGVTVAGSTRLVTNGDLVDRETYEALLEAGAIRPFEEAAPPAREPDQE